MRTVWKYEIQPNSIARKSMPIRIAVPERSKLLSVGNQRGTCCAWVEVDDQEDPTEEITLYCVGTGFGAVEKGLKFFSTVVMDPYVWHFYVKEIQDAEDKR